MSVRVQKKNILFSHVHGKTIRSRLHFCQEEALLIVLICGISGTGNRVRRDQILKHFHSQFDMPCNLTCVCWNCENQVG